MIAYSEHFGPKEATNEEDLKSKLCSSHYTEKLFQWVFCLLVTIKKKMYGFCKLIYMWKNAPLVWEERSLGGIYNAKVRRESWQLTILIQLKKKEKVLSLLTISQCRRESSPPPVNYIGQSSFRESSCVPAAQLLDSDPSIYISTF